MEPKTAMDINQLLMMVVDRGGSDLHLVAGAPPIMRRHGTLVQIETEPLAATEIKDALYSALTLEQRDAVDRRSEVDLAYSVPCCARFRVNVYRQRSSLCAAFRMIPHTIPSLAELRLPSILEDLAKLPRGIVLVTGPTGSGKSTTLASVVDLINATRDAHIVTIEDPIEYLHEHKRGVVCQREIGSDTANFADALKYVLRQDPDVILIGEMRDYETMAAALSAAETGHLVLSTLHTQGATQSIDRVIDAFPPHQQAQVRIQFAVTFQGAISQQLLPRADGSGRVVATELLLATPAVRNLIREAKTHQLDTIMQSGGQQGMLTMDQSLADLCKRGIISFDAAKQKAADVKVLLQHLGRTG